MSEHFSAVLHLWTVSVICLPEACVDSECTRPEVFLCCVFQRYLVLWCLMLTFLLWFFVFQILNLILKTALMSHKVSSKWLKPLLFIFSRVRLNLTYLHFFLKTRLNLICSRDFVFCLLFQYLRDTISRFVVIQLNLLVECHVSEILCSVSLEDMVKLRWTAWFSCVFIVCPKKSHHWLNAGDTIRNTVRWLENIVSYIQKKNYI